MMVAGPGGQIGTGLGVRDLEWGLVLGAEPGEPLMGPGAGLRGGTGLRTAQDALGGTR
jgi:hypothetical protein